MQTTYREIIYSLEQEALMPKTRYVDFFKTSGNRRRLIVAITLALATVSEPLAGHEQAADDVLELGRQRYHLLVSSLLSRS